MALAHESGDPGVVIDEKKPRVETLVTGSLSPTARYSIDQCRRARTGAARSHIILVEPEP
jgi:hypothetical protein